MMSKAKIRERQRMNRHKKRMQEYYQMYPEKKKPIFGKKKFAELQHLRDCFIGIKKH